METIKVCRDCRHLALQHDKFVCRAVGAVKKLNVVLGEYEHQSAYAMRAHKGKCGEEGKLWEPIPEPEPMEPELLVELPSYANRPTVRERFGTLAAAWGHLMMAPARGMGRVWDGLTVRVHGAMTGYRLAVQAVNPPESKQDGVIEPVKEGEAPKPPAEIEGETAPAKPETPEGKLIPFEPPSAEKQNQQVGALVALACIMVGVGILAAGELARPMGQSATGYREPCKIGSRDTCCPKGEGRCYPCIPTAV